MTTVLPAGDVTLVTCGEPVLAVTAPANDGRTSSSVAASAPHRASKRAVDFDGTAARVRPRRLDDKTAFAGSLTSGLRRTRALDPRAIRRRPHAVYGGDRKIAL